MIFIFIVLSLYEIFIAKNFNLQKGVPFFYTNDINYKPYFFIEAIPNYDYITGTIQINYSPLFEGFPNNFYIGETYNYRTTSYNTRRSLSLKFDLTKREYSFNFTHVPFHTKTKQLFLEYDFNEIQVIDMTITLDVTANIFELTDGISKTFSDLIPGHSYYFYIKSTGTKAWKNANLSLTMDYNFENPFKLVHISEHSSLDSYWRSQEEVYKHSLFSNEGDESTIFIPYTISLYSTKYVSFQITLPKYNIDYISVKIDLGGNFYLVTDYNYKFNNLAIGNNYDFVISAKEKQLVKINLTMNYMENIPFDSINIEELKESKSLINKTTMENITSKYLKVNNQYIISLDYYVFSYDAYYISLGILPEYDIKNITVIRKIGGGVFNCFSGKEYPIELIPGYPYYIYTQVKEKEKIYVDLILRMVQQTFNILNGIYVYEYTYRNSSSFNRKEEYNTGNTKVISFTYEFKNKSTNYVAIHFIPKEKSLNFFAKLTIAGGAFDCVNGTKKEYKDLIGENDYYFYIRAKVNKYISIEINAQNSNYLNYIKIYEYSKRYDDDFLKETKQSVIIKESNDQKFSLNSYKVISNLTNYICFKINPKMDTTFTIQINVTDFNNTDTDSEPDKKDDDTTKNDTQNKETEEDDTEKEDKSGNDKPSIGKEVIAAIIVGSIIFIIIIAVVIIMLKKPNKLKSSDINGMEYSPIQPNQPNELK